MDQGQNNPGGQAVKAGKDGLETGCVAWDAGKRLSCSIARTCRLRACKAKKPGVQAAQGASRVAFNAILHPGIAALYWGDNLVLSDDGKNGLELNNSSVTAESAMPCFSA